MKRQPASRRHLSGSYSNTILAIVALFILLVSTTSCAVVPTEQLSESGDESSDCTASALVVYFSRTGNTAVMAKQIANRYQANIVRIKAAAYEDSFMGFVRANREAWNGERWSEISPDVIQMSCYDVIFIGSPVWWYRPAVPLWTFVSKNNFHGKPVVLFNTFNSRFKGENISEFKTLIEDNGGKFTDHIYVRRGRVYDQISREELISEIEKVLTGHESRWLDELK